MTTDLIAYRQTYNKSLDRWNIPKKKEVLKAANFNKQRKHRWVPINNADKLRGKTVPYINAIQKLQRIAEKIQDSKGRKVWATTMVSRKAYHASNQWNYLIFYLTCQRISYEGR
jgi:hypothetical protein